MKTIKYVVQVKYPHWESWEDETNELDSLEKAREYKDYLVKNNHARREVRIVARIVNEEVIPDVNKL